MSEATKKLRIDRSTVVLRVIYQGNAYNIPKKIADQYKEKSNQKVSGSVDAIFTNLEKKYTKAGVLLQGLRHREGLTQAQFSKKIDVTQSDLSKMENGKRPIGKIIAKRIEKIFNVNYRYFLE